MKERNIKRSSSIPGNVSVELGNKLVVSDTTLIEVEIV